MHSVAYLATLQTPLATFFPLKKCPNLVTGTAARGLALPARAHTSLSLSLSLRLLSFSPSARRTHTSFSLSLSLRLLSFSPSARRTHTSFSLSLSLSLSASAQFLSQRAAEEQRFNSVKHRYYVASLILHSSIAKITAQLLSLFYVYLISSDDGTIINQDFCAD